MTQIKKEFSSLLPICEIGALCGFLFRVFFRFRLGQMVVTARGMVGTSRCDVPARASAGGTLGGRPIVTGSGQAGAARRSVPSPERRRGYRRAMSLRGIATAIVALVALTTASTAHATDYYVDSRIGSDDAAGTLKKPWRSLERLNEVTFHPGDRVLFARGSQFEGTFVVDESGTAEAPITLTAYGEGALPHFTNPKADTFDGNAMHINASHIIVENCFFERCPANPCTNLVKHMGAIFLTTNADFNIVRNCEMTQTPQGVTVYGQHNLVTKNYIHDDNEPIKDYWGPMGIVICASHNEVSYNRVENYCAPSTEYGHDGGAIEINDRALPKVDVRIHHNLSLRNQGFIEWVGKVMQDDFVIHHNVCMDYQSFLGLTGPCTNFRVENNTVVRTLAHAEPDSEDVVFWIYEPGNTNISFRNNIFAYDGTKVEPMFARGELEHSYNLYWRMDEAAIPKQANHEAYVRKYLGGGARLQVGDRLGDPLFRDLAAGDFHLKAGSPAITAGVELGYTVDFDDKLIPAGKPPTMGAYEFISNDAAAPAVYDKTTPKAKPPAG